MTPLSEVAQDVAQALGLELFDYIKFGKTMSPPVEVIHNKTFYRIPDDQLSPELSIDGSNLTDPYWRCRCEDWLDERGWHFSNRTLVTAWHKDDKGKRYHVEAYCPWPEAPARLVSAVWRRMQEEKA